MFKGYKTLIVNILVLVIAIFGGKWGFDLPWFHTKEAVELVAVLNIILRFVTNSPVFNRES